VTLAHDLRDVRFLTWADEFYLRSHHRSAALLDPATIDSPRIHWKDG
jgi:NADH:ubiquinone reductase (H+-translocating)